MHGNAGPSFFCSSPSWGGLEINVLRLAVWLTERGRPVTVLAPGDTPLFRAATERGLEVVPMPRHRKYFDFTSAGLLAGTLKRLGIRSCFVFHRNDMDVAAWARFLGGRRLHMVHQQHMRLGVSRRDPVHALRYRAYSAWICPLEYLREEVLALTTVPPGKIHVIPLGIDPAAYDGADRERAGARSFFGIRPEAKVFGILGRIEPGKGQAFVLRALKALRDSGKEYAHAEALIVGDVTIEPGARASGGRLGTGATHAEELRALAGSLGLGGAVHFHPFITDNRKFFAAVDAAVMAAAHETYGMVTLEAMAAGVPVIGTDATGTREILEGGRLGMVYPAWDEGAFLAHARTVVAGGVPGGMLDAARRTVRERYSHERQCRMTADLLDRLEGQAPPGT